MAGFTAKSPVSTPVFFLDSWRSTSERFFAHAAYSASFALPRAAARATIGCSGATTMYVAPKSVSGRVVNTVSGSASPSTAKWISAPSLRPIHSVCMVRVESGQSTSARSASSRSAYAVMRNIHCLSGMRTTGCPPRSLRPSMISSLASTVPSFAHQFTVCVPRYASRKPSRYAWRSRLLHALQRLRAPPVTSTSRSSSASAASSSAIGRAAFAFGSNQLPYASSQIHCVQR